MRMAEKWNEKWPKNANCVMISQSQCIGIPNMMLEGSVSPVPPVRRAMNLPRPSTMMDPESPCTENGPCYSCRWLLPPNLSNGCIWYWGTWNMGFKSIKASNCGEWGGPTLYHISQMVFFVVFTLWHACIFGGENASELEEAFSWIIKIMWRIDARVHQIYKLVAADLRAWNYEQLDKTPLATRQISTLHAPKSSTLPLKFCRNFFLLSLTTQTSTVQLWWAVWMLIGGAQLMYPMTWSCGFSHCLFTFTKNLSRSSTWSAHVESPPAPLLPAQH